MPDPLLCHWRKVKTVSQADADGETYLRLGLDCGHSARIRPVDASVLAKIIGNLVPCLVCGQEV